MKSLILILLLAQATTATNTKEFTVNGDEYEVNITYNEIEGYNECVTEISNNEEFSAFSWDYKGYKSIPKELHMGLHVCALPKVINSKLNDDMKLYIYSYLTDHMFYEDREELVFNDK
jgi:hypothetical protein